MDKRIKAKRFQVDQPGIDKLKNQCFNEAKEFSYFRKVEWTGILSSIENAETFQAEWPMVTMSALAVYPGAKAIAKDAADLVKASTATFRDFCSKYMARRRRKNHVCRRVICSSVVRKTRISRWEDICGKGGVVTIPKSHVGPFTYIVSDRMWAIFTRFGKNDLRGLHGNDSNTISMLRKRFDLEFNSAKMRKK